MTASRAPRPKITAGDWLIERVGHFGIGADLKLLSKRFGIEPKRLIRDEPDHYEVAVPGHGLILQLAAEKNAERPTKTMRADAWSLAGVILLAPAAKSPPGVWAWPWPFGIDPDHLTYESASAQLGEDNTGSPQRDTIRRTTFFIEGKQGVALAIELRFAPGFNRLEQLWATHLGNAQPLTAV
jgi:hypothetical protein